jgi:transcriptional regulator with XRE-family HTH domain
LPNRIRELRKEKRITQLQLSIELGVTQETISAYEHGKHLPSLAALIRMSEIFHTSMDYIMGLSPTEQSHNSEYYANDEQRDYLMRCYRRLGTKNKARLVSYAEGLLDSQKD